MLSIQFIIYQIISLKFHIFIASIFPSVGVHCTHGFNRTGFLIIAYLVEKDDWR